MFIRVMDEDYIINIERFLDFHLNNDRILFFENTTQDNDGAWKIAFKSEQKAKACMDDIYEALKRRDPVMTINKEDLI